MKRREFLSGLAALPMLSWLDLSKLQAKESYITYDSVYDYDFGSNSHKITFTEWDHRYNVQTCLLNVSPTIYFSVKKDYAFAKFSDGNALAIPTMKEIPTTHLKQHMIREDKYLVVIVDKHQKKIGLIPIDKEKV